MYRKDASDTEKKENNGRTGWVQHDRAGLLCYHTDKTDDGDGSAFFCIFPRMAFYFLNRTCLYTPMFYSDHANPVNNCPVFILPAGFALIFGLLAWLFVTEAPVHRNTGIPEIPECWFSGV